MPIALDPSRAPRAAALLGALLDAGAARDRLDAATEPLRVTAERTATPRGTRLDLHTADTPQADRSLRDAAATLDRLDLPGTVHRDAGEALALAARARADASGADDETTDDGVADPALPVVGTDRAVAAVAGVALLAHDLGGDLVTTPVPVGTGEGERVALALAERADWAVRPSGDADSADLPALAALAALADGVTDPPAMDLRATGYAAPVADDPGRDSAPLRVLVGDLAGDDRGVSTGAARAATDPRAPHSADSRPRPVRDGGHAEMSVLETTIDDASPEVLGSLQETLPEAGAADVTVLPTTGKRSRPGHLVRVVTRPEDADDVAERLVRETGTLGVLESGAVHRRQTYSTVETVTVTVDGTEFDVGVKVTTDDDDDDDLVDVSAELADALAVAGETDLPVRDVLRRAETAYHDAAAAEREYGEGGDERS